MKSKRFGCSAAVMSNNRPRRVSDWLATTHQPSQCGRRSDSPVIIVIIAKYSLPKSHRTVTSSPVIVAITVPFPSHRYSTLPNKPSAATAQSSQKKVRHCKASLQRNILLSRRTPPLVRRAIRGLWRLRSQQRKRSMTLHGPQPGGV